ncbi:AI-2E family transporter [Planococcus sp. N028]|uniref:AI-2E family transporter n=1 Tax=Planococcus shixiaomingii TaxID=3058393 RepID=A0ABT8N5U6_9BACL|nr:MULTISPECIES: AI-2E family transporter [unclassified Planococcus (in: firmicutes)]MDN7243255.1 AI-2E family transporter [Planococcus sp. N028]WKA55197.1 AI-2E family transporter [Planococcus sp. N022]
MTSKLWFQAGVGIILALIIIRLFIEVQAIFDPLFIIAQTIFVPLLLGGVLFYLTRPILYFLEKRKFPKWAGILSIVLIIVFVLWLFYTMIGPIVTEQINALVANAPEIIEGTQGYIQYILDQRDRLPASFEEQLNSITEQFGSIATGVGTWVLSFLTSFISGLFTLVLVPFFLIYLLVDHHKFVPFISGFFAGPRNRWIRKTMHDIDHTLQAYIQGQLFVSFLVGVMLLIGYLIIGLEYALLLAIIGMATNVIPFLGPYIAVIPAIIIALVQDPIKAVYVGIIMLVAQQIESNLISPNVMGNALDVHPLTVITLILAAGNIAGLWGIILAIPVYAVLKTIAKNVYARRQEIGHTVVKDVD